MLKSRLLTALVLISVVLWSIFFAPPIVFIGLMAFFLGVGAWEWTGLVPMKCIYGRLSYVVLIEAVWAALYWDCGNACYSYLSCLNGVWLLAAVAAVLTYPRTLKFWHYRWVTIVFGFLLLVTTGYSLLWLKELPHGNAYLLTLLLLTWAADTGAYFAGRFWGKRKFSPSVSPNKTWAGFWGGFVLSQIVIIAAGFAIESTEWTSWIVTGTFALLGAVVGDLLISMLKRSVGVKDTGKILPGHGGVLDRVDSLLISTVVMTFFLYHHKVIFGYLL